MTKYKFSALSGVPKTKGKRHADHRGGAAAAAAAAEKANTFHVPRNLELSLETAPVSPLDLVHLRYYTEYQWLVDFSLYTGIVYTLSEVQFYCEIDALQEVLINSQIQSTLRSIDSE